MRAGVGSSSRANHEPLLLPCAFPACVRARIDDCLSLSILFFCQIPSFACQHTHTHTHTQAKAGDGRRLRIVSRRTCTVCLRLNVAKRPSRPAYFLCLTRCRVHVCTSVSPCMRIGALSPLFPYSFYVFTAARKRQGNIKENGPAFAPVLISGLFSLVHHRLRPFPSSFSCSSLVTHTLVLVVYIVLCIIFFFGSFFAPSPSSLRSSHNANSAVTVVSRSAFHFLLFVAASPFSFFFRVFLTWNRRAWAACASQPFFLRTADIAASPPLLSTLAGVFIFA